MKVRCAWCVKEMGEKSPYSDPTITHSICDDCLCKQLKSAHKPATPSPEFKERLLAELREKSVKVGDSHRTRCNNHSK